MTGGFVYESMAPTPLDVGAKNDGQPRTKLERTAAANRSRHGSLV